MVVPRSTSPPTKKCLVIPVNSPCLGLMDSRSPGGLSRTTSGPLSTSLSPKHRSGMMQTGNLVMTQSAPTLGATRTKGRHNGRPPRLNIASRIRTPSQQISSPGSPSPTNHFLSSMGCEDLEPRCVQLIKPKKQYHLKIHSASDIIPITPPRPTEPGNEKITLSI